MIGEGGQGVICSGRLGVLPSPADGASGLGCRRDRPPSGGTRQRLDCPEAATPGRHFRLLGADSTRIGALRPPPALLHRHVEGELPAVPRLVRVEWAGEVGLVVGSIGQLEQGEAAGPPVEFAVG